MRPGQHAIVLLAGLAGLFFSQICSAEPQSHGLRHLAGTGVELKPNYERIGEAEAVWQKPDEPKGVLVLFHGCSHSGTDFWPKSEACPKCLGLPLETIITKVALSKGFAVVAITSADRDFYQCWGPSLEPQSPSEDVGNVKGVLEALLPREDLHKLPLFALGASSGGSFALTLSLYIPFAGICAQIAAPPSRVFEGLLTSLKEVGTRKYPPTYFVHMPRDTFTGKYVRLAVSYLKEQGIPVAEHTIEPRPVDAEFLSDHLSSSLPKAAAETLVQELKSAGILDKDTSLLLDDPRRSDWRKVVAASKGPGVSSLPVEADKSGLSEILNLAWAGHEIVAESTAEVLDWLQSQAQGVDV